jgi:hypothetical protein
MWQEEFADGPEFTILDRIYDIAQPQRCLDDACRGSLKTDKGPMEVPALASILTFFF